MTTAFRTALCSLLLLTTTFWHTAAKAQQKDFVTIPGLPSHEAYNILKDSKGYLWVGHEFGISRYDGTTIITLHHPRQSSLSMTDLVEDKRGRIWCHNFSGQIFYVENMQLHLLEQYNYKEELGFPRIALCGGELVASSIKGLFIYNTLTDQSKYLRIKAGTILLTRLGNKIVCFNNDGWFSYEAGKPITPLIADPQIPNLQFVTLPNLTLKDTFYIFSNAIGMYYKLTLEHNKIKVLAKSSVSSYINTFSAQGQKVWVHTRESSFSTDGNDSIAGMDLSDVLVDPQGNRWLTSLRKGLCVQYNVELPKKLEHPLLGEGDGIHKIQGEGDELFLGTLNGKLYRLPPDGTLRYIVSLPPKAGAVERIAFVGNGQLLLGGSTELYVYDLQTGSLQQLPVPGTIKDVIAKNGIVYLATNNGIGILPIEQIKHPSPSFAFDKLGKKYTRSRSIAYAHDSLIAVYNDGIFIMHQNSFTQLLYKNFPIYASTVRSIGDRVVIGTFNQGLLILENGKFRNITEKEGLASNFIRDIKTIGGTTWLIFPDRFQQLNACFTGVNNYAFPFARFGSINDFSVLDEHLFVATGEGMFSMQLAKPSAGIHTATFIDKITVNGKELLTGNQLQHFQNHLQFQVSTPFFLPGAKITYQYRLRNAPDSTWQEGAPDQTAFNLVALEPGIYDFEVVATDENKRVISRPAIYHFEIEPAWYQRWAFRVGAALALAAIGFFVIRFYYRSRLRKQRQDYEKVLAVQAERQRISAEIHDDIGAGLSAIRLLTEITKNSLPENSLKQEVRKIHSSISELSHKMREVIWSLNTDNDNLENLLFYIRRQALVLFENSPIRLKVIFPSQEIPALEINGEKRRHIYLAVKEALHNCLKHSQAQTCFLSMDIKNALLYITIADDGKGFAPAPGSPTGNGLANMQRRMKQVAGTFDMGRKEKTEVRFVIPLNEKS